MTNKFPRKHLAPGTWSNPWKRIEVGQEPHKVRVMLYDKLRARGRPVELWLPVTSTTPGVVDCTCTKDTTQSAERLCMSCYGAKRAPGFLKFAHQTLFWASAEASGWTLTGCALDTSVKPHRVLLTTGSTSGTMVTTGKAYTNPDGLDWAAHVDAFLRDSDNTVTTEFSTSTNNATWGAWTAIADINGLARPDDANGYIRLRITLARTSAFSRSPAFEIARVRRVMAENANRQLLVSRADMSAGQVLILRTPMVARTTLEAGRGRVTDHLTDKMWTAGLSWFDTARTADTPDERIDDASTLVHPFYAYSIGAQTGLRYELTSVTYSDQMGTFTSQSAVDRRVQEGEPTAFVW